MNSFEELENTWSNQKHNSPKISPDQVIERANKDSEQVLRNFRITMIILGLTCVGLLVFMLVNKTYTHPLLFTCNSAMIVLLLIRTGLEWYSHERLKKVSFASSVNEQVSMTEQFYSWRKRINFIASPLIFLTYWGVFYYLTPLFKIHLSSGMFSYVMFSGVVLFLGLGWIISKDIKKEMEVLNKMRDYLSYFK